MEKHEHSRKLVARSGERGFALVEASVAIVVLALLGAAIAIGFTVVVRSGETHHAASDNASAQRDVVTGLLDVPYVSCGTVGGYNTALGTEYSPPSGVTVAVLQVEYWNSASSPATFRTGPCDTAAPPTAANGDSGLQRLSYRVTATRSGQDVTVHRSVLKRNTSPYPEPPPDPPPGGYRCTISADVVPSQLYTNWVNQTAWDQSTVHSSDDHMDILYLNGTRRFSYVWFKVDSSSVCNEGGTLGAGRTILSARLQLYTFNIGGLPACGANSCWHALEKVNASWNPSTLNWNNQPCPGSGAIWLPSCRSDGQPGVLFEHGTGALDWSPRYQVIEAPMLTADVQSFYANPSTNYGWRIREACDGAAGPYNKACGTATPGFQFRSRTASNAIERPRLVVTYK